MERRDFGLWGLELSADDFACALAARGVAAFKVAVGYGLDSVEDVVKALTEEVQEAAKFGYPISWRLDGGREKLPEGWQPPSAARLAEGWKKFRATYGESLRLAVDEEWGSMFWLVEQLSRPAVNVNSVYLRTDRLTEDPIWHWPLKVGFLGDAASQALLKELEGNYWVQQLWDPVTLGQGRQDCDILLLPFSARRSTVALLEAPRVRASCVVVLGRTKEPDDEAFLMMALSGLQTGAAGLSLSYIPPGRRNIWFGNFIDELAHNNAIDVAFFMASRSINARPPTLLLDQRFARLARVSKRLEILTQRLEGAGPEMTIDLPPAAGGSLGLPPGPHSGRTVVDHLRDRVKEQGWEHESDAAKTVAEVTRSARPALETAPPPKPDARWIQAQVRDSTTEAEPALLTRAFRAGAPHRVDVRIGARDAEWLAGKTEFPMEQLPDEESHLLQVVFSEPRLLPDPQTDSIILPKAGNSSTANFYLHIPEGVDRVDARITVVHENRVLQTALLRGSVVAAPAEAPRASKIELAIEAVIRPGLGALRGRSRFDAALVLNHDDGRVAGVTKIANRHSSFSSPSGLDDEIKWFDDQLSEIADDPEQFAGGLGADATVGLLRKFAKHGSLLYESIVEDRAVDDGIARARRLQVISAEPEARLPVEFIYDREPPEPDAPLCEHAAKALEDGDCLTACPHDSDQGSVICPLGFWGLNRVIERHAHDKEMTSPLPNWDFTLQAEPVTTRRGLDLLSGALVGASGRVDKKTPGGVASVQAEIEKAIKRQPKVVTKWKDWAAEIQAHSPPLLVLLVHTEYSEERLQQLEIGEGDWLEVVYLKEKYVREPRTKPAPLVLLIGCETGAPELAFHGFVAKLRRSGAAIVVSTGATILGRHATPVAREFVRELAEFSKAPESSFGDVMLRVRQKLLAQGMPMVLCLMSYGDADWRLGATQ
jgi:hypothetical protein